MHRRQPQQPGSASLLSPVTTPHCTSAHSAAQHIDPWGWRLSLALAGVPGCLLFFGALMLPDTPNSLIERGKLERGEAVLVRIRGTHGECAAQRRAGRGRARSSSGDASMPASTSTLCTHSHATKRTAPAAADVSVELEDIVDAVNV